MFALVSARISRSSVHYYLPHACSPLLAGWPATNTFPSSVTDTRSLEMAWKGQLGGKEMCASGGS